MVKAVAVVTVAAAVVVWMLLSMMTKMMMMLASMMMVMVATLALARTAAAKAFAVLQVTLDDRGDMEAHGGVADDVDAAVALLQNSGVGVALKTSFYALFQSETSNRSYI